MGGVHVPECLFRARGSRVVRAGDWDGWNVIVVYPVESWGFGFVVCDRLLACGMLVSAGLGGGRVIDAKCIRQVTVDVKRDENPL